MEKILNISQIFVSILLIASILLQKGTSQFFGSETGLYRTLRGAEKKLFWFTAVLTFIFVCLGILNLLV